MNPMSEEGNQKLLHQGSGTIPALADEELMGEDDDYDDLYSDVNVGESFFQAHHQAQTPAQVGGTSSGSLQAQNTNNVAEPRTAILSGGAVEGKYRNDGVHSGTNGQETRSDTYTQGSSFGAKGMNVDVQSNKIIPQGSTSIVLNTHGYSGNAVNVPEPPVHNPYGGAPQGAQQIPVSQTNVNPNAMVNRSPTQPFVVDNGNTMLFVGELHWWTTDAEIEGVLSQYGRVKEIKFFDERVSGKSKGYCQVEFYESAAAAACKEGMNGFVFNGKACVVAFASPETLKQMGANFTGRNQGQNQIQNRRPLNEGMGRGNYNNNNSNNNNNMNTQNGDGGRNYGRGGFARGSQGMGNRGGSWGGAMRGRGINNMANGSGAGPYGPGLAGPSFGGMMHPQGMMGAGGFDPTFMGRGGGYGGFSGLAYPGMAQSYPGVNAMGMVGIAPHVNPAFFGTGMGTMGNTGMNGAAMWNEASGGGGGEEGGSEYGGYEDENQEKEEKPSRDKERATTERDWSESSGDRRHKSHHREEKDSHRDYKHRDSEEFDRGQSSMKSRSRSRMSDDDHRSRSRDADYGKRRRGD